MQRVQRSKILTGLNICLDTLKVSKKVTGVEYAIRDIVLAAKKVEQKGMKVDYLNIGDPVQFGFPPPDNVKQALIDAVNKGENYYSESEGLLELREEIAKKENVQADSDALHIIAEKADGAMRDALSIFDQNGTYRTRSFSQ